MNNPSEIDRLKCIGEKIRTRREQFGLSQRKFAKKIDVSYATVARIENGETESKPSILEKIAVELQMDLNALIPGYPTNLIPINIRPVDTLENAILEMWRIMDPEDRRHVIYLMESFTIKKGKNPFHRPGDEPGKLIPVKLLVDVAAGKPINSIEQPDMIDVPKSLVNGDDYYAVIARGDSMVDIGIEDKSILLCRDIKNIGYKPGDIVVAEIDQSDLTVKKYAGHVNGQRKLMPENTAYDPQIYPEERCIIKGVVVAIRRHNEKWQVL